MEDSNFIGIARWNYESLAVFDEWNKWSKASRTLLVMSTGMTMGVERCFQLQAKPFYANSITIGYYKNLENFFKHWHSSQRQVLNKDTETSWGGKIENSWQTNFLLVRRFTEGKTALVDDGEIVDKTTRLKEFTEGSEPVILLRGLRLTHDDWKYYDSWFVDWGNDVYIPMLLKIPGVTEYSRFWLAPINHGGVPQSGNHGKSRLSARPFDYPF